MKKFITYFSIILILIFGITNYTNISSTGNKEYVIDDADILTTTEENNLRNKINQIREKYDYEVVIVTNPSTEGKTPMRYADDYFDENGYGYGPNKDGMLLLITFSDHEGMRSYWTSTSGYGIEAFTDYGLSYIHQLLQTALSNGAYYEGINTYLDLVDDYLNEAHTAVPYDTNHEIHSKEESYAVLGGGGIIGAIVSSFTVMRLKRKMKTNIRATQADRYYTWSDVNIDDASDVYLYSHTTQRIISDDNHRGGSGGGSSIHISSSGGSHGGGGGHF